MVVDWGLISAVVAIVTFIGGLLTWGFTSYVAHKVRQKVEANSITSLLKRVETIEVDIKEMLNANSILARGLYSEINKIVHKLGDKHET